MATRQSPRTVCVCVCVCFAQLNEQLVYLAKEHGQSRGIQVCLLKKKNKSVCFKICGRLTERSLVMSVWAFRDVVLSGERIRAYKAGREASGILVFFGVFIAMVEKVRFIQPSDPSLKASVAHFPTKSALVLQPVVAKILVILTKCCHQGRTATCRPWNPPAQFTLQLKNNLIPVGKQLFRSWTNLSWVKNLPFSYRFPNLTPIWFWILDAIIWLKCCLFSTWTRP